MSLIRAGVKLCSRLDLQGKIWGTLAYSYPGVTTIPISSFSLSLLFLIVVNCRQWFSQPILMTASASYHKRHLVNAIFFLSRKYHKQWLKSDSLDQQVWWMRWGCGLIGCLSLPVWLCSRWKRISQRLCVCLSLSLSLSLSVVPTLPRPCLAYRKDIAKYSAFCSSLIHTHAIINSDVVVINLLHIEGSSLLLSSSSL